VALGEDRHPQLEHRSLESQLLCHHHTNLQFLLVLAYNHQCIGIQECEREVIPNPTNVISLTYRSKSSYGTSEHGCILRRAPRYLLLGSDQTAWRLYARWRDSRNHRLHHVDRFSQASRAIWRYLLRRSGHLPLLTNGDGLDGQQCCSPLGSRYSHWFPNLYSKLRGFHRNVHIRHERCSKVC